MLFRNMQLLTVLFVVLFALNCGMAETPVAEFFFENNVTNYGQCRGVGQLLDVSGMSPTYASGGVSGYCLDNTSASGMGQQGGSLRFDSSSALSKNLTNLRSFTIMGWVKSSSALGSNAGIFSSPGDGGFILRCASNNKLLLQIDGNNFTSSTQANYGASDWKFFAVSYDGTTIENNVKFYYGFNDGEPQVTLDSVSSCSLGTLFREPGFAYVGNVNTSGSSPFDGMLDSIRVFATRDDNSAALTIEQIQDWKIKNALNYRSLCAVDMRFEGNTLSWGSIVDHAFFNDVPGKNIYPGFLESDGVEGTSCLDNTAADSMGGRGPYCAIGSEANQYGVCSLLDNLKSFTVTGWIKSSLSLGGQAVIVDYYDSNGNGFSVNCNNPNRITLNINGESYESSTAGNFGCSDWKYFAVRYDGTKTTSNIRFYFGNNDGTDNITIDTVAASSLGTVICDVGGLGVGNRGTVAPFDGYLDSIKIFASKDDNSAALSSTQMKAAKIDNAPIDELRDLPTIDIKKGDVAIMRTSSSALARAYSTDRITWNYGTHEADNSNFEQIGIAASQTFNTSNTSYNGGSATDFQNGKNYTNDPTYPSRTRDFDGNLIQKNNDTTLYPSMTSDAYHDDILGRITDILLPLKPYNIQFDTPSSERHAFYLGYGVGFEADEKENFRQYLENKYTDGELQTKFNISDISTFDFRQWLIDEYGITNNSEYVAQRYTYSLTPDFEIFLEDEIVDLFTELRDTMHAANPNAYISCNMGGLRWYNRGLISVVDFINFELPRAKFPGLLDYGDSLSCKLAETFDIPMIGVNNKDTSRFILENDADVHMKCLTAAMYANGQIMMTPWNIWAGKGDDGIDERYWGGPEIYGAYFKFISDNRDLFDDYVAQSQVALLWNCDSTELDSLHAQADRLFDDNVPFDVIALGDRYPYSRFDVDQVADKYPAVVRCDQVNSWTAENQATVNELATKIQVYNSYASQTSIDSWVSVTGRSKVWALPRKHKSDPTAAMVMHVVNRSYDRNNDTVDLTSCGIIIDNNCLDNMTVKEIVWMGPESPSQALTFDQDSKQVSFTLPFTPVWSMLKIQVEQRQLGDIDASGLVDIDDILILAQEWLKCNDTSLPGCIAGDLSADLDNNSKVNLADLALLAENWIK